MHRAQVNHGVGSHSHAIRPLQPSSTEATSYYTPRVSTDCLPQGQQVRELQQRAQRFAQRSFYVPPADGVDVSDSSGVLFRGQWIRVDSIPTLVISIKLKSLFRL